MSIKTFPIAQVAAEICGDSMLDPERWLIRQIKAGRVTARKVGRHWRMTQQDVDDALAALANKTAPPPATTPPFPGPAAAPTTAISQAAMRRRRMNPTTQRGVPA